MFLTEQELNFVHSTLNEETYEFNKINRVTFHGETFYEGQVYFTNKIDESPLYGLLESIMFVKKEEWDSYFCKVFWFKPTRRPKNS